MPAVPEAALEALGRAELVYDRETVDRAIDRLAVRLTVELADANPALICVMNGGVVIAAELLRRLRFPLTFDYVHATRYHGTQGGELRWRVAPPSDLGGRVVLVVDDVLDRGRTLEAIVAALAATGVARVVTAVLLDKRVAPPRKISADFAALAVDDRYVFGCGLDYHGYWRNLDSIYAVAETAPS